MYRKQLSISLNSKSGHIRVHGVNVHLRENVRMEDITDASLMQWMDPEDY